jgi:hypothetical protein
MLSGAIIAGTAATAFSSDFESSVGDALLGLIPVVIFVVGARYVSLRVVIVLVTVLSIYVCLWAITTLNSRNDTLGGLASLLAVFLGTTALVIPILASWFSAMARGTRTVNPKRVGT